MRNLASRGNLQIEVRSQRTAKRHHALVAGFGDLAGAFRERHFNEFAGGIQLEQTAFLVERVERPFDRNLPIVLAAFPVIFTAPDGLPEMGVADEPRALAVGATGVEGKDERLDQRLMFPVADADQLQPAGPEREVIVGADVGKITIELGPNVATALFACGEDAVIAPHAGVPVGRVAERQIADRRAGPVEAELQLEVRPVKFGMINFLAGFGDHAVSVVNPDRPAERPATRIVLQRYGVVDRPLLARVTDRPRDEVRLGIMRAENRIIFELAGCLGRRV